MSTLNPATFVTGDVRPNDQFEAWCEWFSPVFDISPQQKCRGFAAENHIWDLGTVLISRVSAPPVRVVRGKGNLRKAPVDHWVLTYCRQGETSIRSERTILKAGAGEPFLWSLGETIESDRTSVERIQIFLPRNTFQDIAPILDAARGAVLDTAMGRLLGDYMIVLERWLPSLRPEDRPRLAAAVQSMVAACVSPSPDRVVRASDEIHRSRLEQIRQVIKKNMKSPSLQPAWLCRKTGISRSQLYRLFEHSGGVARYIQHQRLLQAYATLSDSRDLRPILTIAEDLCFSDASSFSRAFRQEFGCSPSEVRYGLGGGRPGAGQTSSFRSLQRTLWRLRPRRQNLTGILPLRRVCSLCPSSLCCRTSSASSL